MNGPEAFLHVVGSEKIGDTGELVEKIVLETKHGSRPDDGGFGEN